MNSNYKYRLNFKGFYDTRKNIFGNNNIIEAGSDFDLTDIEEALTECINEVKNKLNIIIRRESIVGIQFMDLEKYAAATFLAERKEYILLVNKNKINSKEELLSAVYHELGHIYQLDRLFNEKVIQYDTFINDLVAATEETKNLLIQHLKDNNEHTFYWLDFQNKVNSIIKPAIKIVAYLDETNKHIIMNEELYEPNYFSLDVDGFYDTYEDIFGARKS